MDWYSVYFFILLIRRWLYTYLRFNRILLSHWLQCSYRLFFPSSTPNVRFPTNTCFGHIEYWSRWTHPLKFMYFAISSHIDWIFFLIQSHGRQVDHKIHISKSKCVVELLSYGRYFLFISFWVGSRHSFDASIEERKKMGVKT